MHFMQLVTATLVAANVAQGLQSRKDEGEGKKQEVAKGTHEPPLK